MIFCCGFVPWPSIQHRHQLDWLGLLNNNNNMAAIDREDLYSKLEDESQQGFMEMISPQFISAMTPPNGNSIHTSSSQHSMAAAASSPITFSQVNQLTEYLNVNNHWRQVAYLLHKYLTQNQMRQANSLNPELFGGAAQFCEAVHNTAIDYHLVYNVLVDCGWSAFANTLFPPQPLAGIVQQQPQLGFPQQPGFPPQLGFPPQQQPQLGFPLQQQPGFPPQQQQLGFQPQQGCASAISPVTPRTHETDILVIVATHKEWERPDGSGISASLGHEYKILPHNECNLHGGISLYSKQEARKDRPSWNCVFAVLDIMGDQRQRLGAKMDMVLKYLAPKYLTVCGYLCGRRDKDALHKVILVDSAKLQETNQVITLNEALSVRSMWRYRASFPGLEIMDPERAHTVICVSDVVRSEEEAQRLLEAEKVDSLDMELYLIWDRCQEYNKHTLSPVTLLPALKAASDYGIDTQREGDGGRLALNNSALAFKCLISHPMLN